MTAYNPTTHWGKDIDALQQQENFTQTIYKGKRYGCCTQPVCFGMCCPTLKNRSYVWVNESSLEVNDPVCFDPIGCNCCCYNRDRVSKKYFDAEAFQPFCGNKAGFANEDDIYYFCYCIPMVCLYNICTKPCHGGVLIATPVPRDHGCFNCVTRCYGCCPCCLLTCFNTTLATGLDDSRQLRDHLTSQLDIFENAREYRKNNPAFPPSIQMK